MSGNDDDVIISWRDRIAKTRAVVPEPEIDLRQSGGRPSPPERLSAAEVALWEKLISSRRPGWFNGALEILETYVVTTLQLQQIEAALRKLKPGTGVRYDRLARLHRQCGAQASLLATRLRLTPSARIDKSQPQDGDVPMA